MIKKYDKQRFLGLDRTSLSPRIPATAEQDPQRTVEPGTFLWKCPARTKTWLSSTLTQRFIILKIVLNLRVMRHIEGFPGEDMSKLRCERGLNKNVKFWRGRGCVFEIFSGTVNPLYNGVKKAANEVLKHYFKAPFWHLFRSIFKSSFLRWSFMLMWPVI
jgi:hypothetical protein